MLCDPSILILSRLEPPANPESPHHGKIVNSPEQIEHDFLSDPKPEDEPSHHFLSSPVPSKPVTYSPEQSHDLIQPSCESPRGGQPVDGADPTDTRNRGPIFVTGLGGIWRKLTILATPETPVGKAPCFLKQMRNIFWNCTL